MSLDQVADGLAVSFDLNGTRVTLAAPPAERLSEALRERAGARDVKVGCNAGDCGACTVLVDGLPVCSCTTAVAQVEGRRVETQAGLAQSDPDGQALVAAFQRHQAAQCGICTPGMMVSAVALLREVADPSEQQVQDALGGVLCRCTGYRKIIDAVRDAKGSATVAPGGVGTAMARVDGLPKVTGAEAFGDDVAPAGALTLRVIRSPHHRAAFTFGDLEAWRAETGLDLVLTAADVPGVNLFGVIPGFEDQPVMAEGEARFRGEAVAAVVGTPERLAGLDLAEFPVTWTPLPHALTPEEGLTAALLHEARAGNIMCRGLVQRGDAEAALAGAAHVVEGDFSTGFIEHGYIEPEAGFAERVGDRIEVHCCTQAPYMNRDAVAKVMGLAPEGVRIVPTAVGGGFGSKLDLTTQPFLALAAWKLGRPVRMAFTRAESISSSTKRHPSQVTMRLGVDAEGRLAGADFFGTFNTGAYASWGPTVANRVPIHASGPYRIADYRARSVAVHTNCTPAGAFRGFGVPQSAVAQEQLLDMAAEALGLDKLEIRRRNALVNGDATVTGQVFETGMGILDCLDALKPHWDRALAEAAAFNAEATGPVRRGVGVASGWYGCGNTSMSNPSTIRAGITADGRILLHQGAVDIGQGSNTVISQIFATALGVPVERIERVSADTDLTPDAGKTSASRQTFITGNAARLCGEALRAQILRLGNVSGAAVIDIAPGAIRLTDGGAERVVPLSGEGYALEATESYDPPTKPMDANGQGDPYAVFGTTAQMAELEVDTALGTVNLLKITAAHDVGRAINPLLVEGQVEGGVAQGIGLALMEEFLPGRTENLHDYLMPTIGDVPPVDTLIIESGDMHGPYGAKGLGEHCLIPTAPAILNAIADASGARIHHLPATPATVRAAILATRA
ncbi:2Fe-2S iron-sulfur cluster binding domain-containing protein [Paroceanicella profunda]|uniref:2Fe-2S iron-sulfur cluster binding domain-containing protein n=1 Tax=Paroceanicella profunda TaxID=2579971 RepID=A0A5B8FZI5_9RHOB|nr:molybdopterin cofactor-binding domain-containing protein [Paroceanicella profunda]QDL91673.1 2Fe-2S iron-sulfur cluster binding domain-containing protein [Paroceanicella profunda]